MPAMMELQLSNVAARSYGVNSRGHEVNNYDPS